MAFVNEYIPEADYENYDLRRICGEHNLKSLRGHMYSRSWTIDRERDAFLIKVWSHHESEYGGWAFYWKGEWIFFEMTIKSADCNRPDNSCWFDYLIKGFSLPKNIEPKCQDVVTDLTQALGDYCGAGVFSTCTQGSASIELIEE